MYKSRWLSVLFGLVIIVALTGLRSYDTFISSTIRNLTFDQYQRLSPRPVKNLPVRVVDIDEESLSRIGQFPWARTEFAKLITTLTELGAAAIVFDVVFSEPDRLSPNRLIKDDDLKTLFGDLRGQRTALDLPDNDKIMAKAMLEANVILAYGSHNRSQGAVPLRKFGKAIKGSNVLSVLPRLDNVTPLVPVLAKAAKGIGNISLPPTAQHDVIRQYQLLWAKDGEIYPSLALEALRVAQGASTYIVIGGSTDNGFVEQVRIGGFAVPTTKNGELWLYYSPNRPDLYVPAYTVLSDKARANEALSDKIAGHIVLIGTSATALFDIKNTPLQDSVPGVSIHAQAIEQILSQTFLSRPDWTYGLEIVMVIVVGVLIVIATTYTSPIFSLIMGGVFAATILGGSWLFFQHYQLLIDPSYPLFAGLLIHFSMTAYRFLVTDRDARFVTDAFSKYVSSDVLEDIQKRPDALRLGGDTRRLTIMFVDVRSFTPLSEGLTPQELVAFVNKLLGRLSHCVTEHGGTVDKYIGDCIMAFWNAPLEVEHHEREACLAALEMRAVLAKLNAKDAFGFRKQGREFAEVRIGIGINTGDACVGNMGSSDRFDYSVIGDAVNVAARMEGASKEVGHDIVISASTADALEGFELKDVGKVALKGKSEKQQMYALLARKKL